MTFDTMDLQGFTRGAEIEVPCDRIDAGLDELWRGIARRSQFAVHRACLLNLVIHAGDTPSEIVARYLATALVGRLPARVILIRARPNESGAGPPKAFVTTSRDPVGVVAEGGRSQVSGEIVILDARGAQLDRIPAVVRATLVPDLATTLWWTGAVPPARSYVTALRDTVDRVVVDSEEIPDDVSVAHLLPPAGSGRLADLTWPRLAPWRTAIARAFDEPSHRSFLRDIDSVTIGLAAHGSRPPDASAVPLLAGWMATALGWRACVRRADRTVCFSARADGASVRVCGEARPSEFRGVVDVTLTAAARVLRFRRTPTGVVEAEVPEGFRAFRPAVFTDVDPVDALAATLLDVHGDPVAPEAIRRAAEIGTALCGGGARVGA